MNSYDSFFYRKIEETIKGRDSSLYVINHYLGLIKEVFLYNISIKGQNIVDIYKNINVYLSDSSCEEKAELRFKQVIFEMQNDPVISRTDSLDAVYARFKEARRRLHSRPKGFIEA